MNRSKFVKLLIGLGALWLLMLPESICAQPVDAGALDQALADATTYQFGDSRTSLNLVEQYVRMVSNDEKARQEIESRLIMLLDEKNTLDCRKFACRQLGTIGSVECVQSLRPLLLDPILGEFAVYALRQIDSDRATTELRRALLNPECPNRLRIVNALGARREREAVRDLKSIATSENESHDIREAAIAAIGRIGETGGMRILQDLADIYGADDEFGMDVTRAIIRASETLEFTPMNPAKAEYLREALERTKVGDLEFTEAMRALLEINDEVAGRRFMEILQNADDQTVRTAVSILNNTVLPYACVGTADAIEQIPEKARPAIIRAVARPTRYPIVAQRMREQLRSQNSAIRSAAIDALAIVGDASDVPTFAQVAASASESERTAARKAIRSLRDEATNAQIAATLNVADDANVRIELITALGDRGAVDEAGAVANVLSQADATQRAAAYEAIAKIGSLSQLGNLIEIMHSAERPEERDRCANAILGIAQRIDDRDERVQPIVKALGGSDNVDVQQRLLAICARLAGRAALDGVRSQLDNPALRSSAIEAMCNWSDDGPVLDLYRIATSAEEESAVREQALLGYIRQSGLAMTGDATVSAARLERGWSLCKSARAKKFALSEMSDVPHEDMLDIAVSEVTSPDVGDEAVDVALEIAEHLKDLNRDMAMRAAHRILDKRDEPELRRKVGEVVNRIQSDEDFVSQWVAAGPYSRNGLGPTELFDVQFAPEIAAEADEVAWTPLAVTDPDSPGIFDLERAVGGSNRCLYVRTILLSEAQTNIRFEFGSDDGLKVWLNGDVIHANNVLRGLAPGSDVVNATLRPGDNVLMLKVTQGGGGWAFTCRVRDALGFHADGVSVVEPDKLGSVPHAATILFDGTGLDEWVSATGGAPRWRITDGQLVIDPGTGSIMTRDFFHDFVLHVGFTIPSDVNGTGQQRGNSGIYLQRRYEVQILESFGLDSSPSDCGAIYGRVAPRLNASREPGEWQEYLIDFTAPKWTGDEQKVENARLTVWHNGYLIHDNVEVEGKTGAGDAEASSSRPILLQDHGNPVHFRNIWVRKKHPTWEGASAPGFEPLFDGDSLAGWVQRGGHAEYRAENGEIIGTTRPNQPNSFLCTERTYRDFVLELQFRVDPELNSGIQIRSNGLPDYQNGRVHGYQVEIDPSERAWSAGIYDEARRGWLASLEENPRAQNAFRQHAWNRLRIEAIGDEFQTYLNGVPAAHLIDDMTSEGFIALQVHGVGGREDPLEVRWRDLRIREIR